MQRFRDYAPCALLSGSYGHIESSHHSHYNLDTGYVGVETFGLSPSVTYRV